MQDEVQTGELSIIKVRGEDDVADGMTKYVVRSKLEKCANDCGFSFRDGRHELFTHLEDFLIQRFGLGAVRHRFNA